MADVGRVLKPGGVLLANVADGPPMTYLRRLLAALGTAFGCSLAISDSSVLRQRRYGNVVLAASNAELPEASIARSVAAAPFPLRLLAGQELTAFVARAKPLRDAAPLRSPAPPDAAWRVSAD